MSVHEGGSKRTDIVYANGEAIAEIDQDDNIYELHNDHLGTPRYITAGNAQKDAARGQLAGQQAFGPYGEEMRGTLNGQALPTGYAPVTGYTGHLNEDLTGLIYMKGRYYSPLWHRFINSDQGVDPASINQYAYVGGSPFMATDPSGMAARYICIYETVTRYKRPLGSKKESDWEPYYSETVRIGCVEIGSSTESSAAGLGPAANNQSPNKEPCEKLKALGITNANLNRMKADMGKTFDSQGQPSIPGTIYQEFGHSFDAIRKTYRDAYRSGQIIGSGLWEGTSFYGSTDFRGSVPKGYTFHTHLTFSSPYTGFKGGEHIRVLPPEIISSGDKNLATFYLNHGYGPLEVNHFLGWSGGLATYDGNGGLSPIAGEGWWRARGGLDCSGILR
jgi:RHS repeat-associated protein